ncbi:MAG: hypothetical protein AB8F94_28900 [Saprospiraceae bacterium]
MKQLFLIFIAIVISNSAFGQTKMKFKVEYSKLYATYNFISKLSDYYPQNEFKKEFLNSKYNNNQYKQKIAQFDTLYIDYRYYFEQYSPTLKNSLASRFLIEKNLISSKTIKEFKTKSFGIVPIEELIALSKIIESFLPIYNELIFEPNQQVFENHLSNINNELTDNEVSVLFNEGLNFYGTNWDSDIPFKIIAFPTIGKSGIGAQAFLNIGVIRFPLNFKSYDVLYSVMLHEMFHIVYDSQPISLKNNLKTWFTNTNSKNSQYASLLLNEVLATSLGNGYAFEKLKNKIDTNDWYYVKYVNLMAKEIYPLIKEYINQKRTIDENFVKKYVAIYDTKFPEWNKELNNIFTYRTILGESRDDTRYIRRNYPPTIHKAIYGISLSGIEALKKEPTTKIIIVSDNHKNKLQLIKDNFAETIHYKFMHQKEFIEIFDLEDRTKLIVINKYNSSVEKLIKSKFKNQKLK